MMNECESKRRFIMNARDHEKLCRKGILIFRRVDTPSIHIRFKCVDHPREWKRFTGNFSSKAERDRHMKVILQLDNCVEDD